MKRMMAMAGLAAALACAGPAPAQWRQWDTSPALSDEARNQLALRQAFSANLFVFFHEVGHGLIAELNLPAVGREEDVVDQFAAYFLVRWSEIDPTIDQILGDAVDSWRRSHIAMQSQGQMLAYWDEHGLDLQRFYNILCYMYGANPAKWNALRIDAGMPDERAERCGTEYRKGRDAWDRLLAPHLVKPGERPPATRGRFRLSYPAVSDPFFNQLRGAYQQSRLYEDVAAVLNELIILPNDITVEATTCDQPNAFWDPFQRKIVMCYELVEWAVGLFGGEVPRTMPPRP